MARAHQPHNLAGVVRGELLDGKEAFEHGGKLLAVASAELAPSVSDTARRIVARPTARTTARPFKLTDRRVRLLSVSFRRRTSSRFQAAARERVCLWRSH